MEYGKVPVDNHLHFWQNVLQLFATLYLPYERMHEGWLPTLNLQITP
jgi:hypothetical protein